jgi:manganese/zinc/iron transport system permease protein
MLWLSALFGIVSGFFGAFISYTAPAMPTGPWIVVVASVITFIAVIFSPGKGVLSRFLRQQKLKQTMADENLLKVFYQLAEPTGNFFQLRSIEEIAQKRAFSEAKLSKHLKRLVQQGYLEQNHSLWKLTEAGYLRAQRIVKIHRLWELYLTTYMNIAPDHVHDDAETIEHLLTPELEKELERQLGYPTADPHQARIPYQKL